MLKVAMSSPRKIISEIRKGIENDLQNFSSALLENLRNNTPLKEGRARRGWSMRKGRNSVKLQNRVPYIERLENNSSKQTNGRGIIKPALRETRSTFRRSR